MKKKNLEATVELPIGHCCRCMLALSEGEGLGSAGELELRETELCREQAVDMCSGVHMLGVSHWC